MRVCPTLAASVLVAALGGGALWMETDGLRALTYESARRLRIANAPVPVPPARLELATGEVIGFADLRGRTVLVDFIYTNCPTVCLALGTTFAQLQRELIGSERHDVRLLSISFDPERDTVEALHAYSDMQGADPRFWSFARVEDAAELRRLLATFGVIVIPDEFGGFTHNAAIHVVDRAGRLAEIFDQEDAAAAFARIARWTPG